MSEEIKAIAAVLTDQLRDDIQQSYALNELCWKVMDMIESRDDVEYYDEIMERLKALLTSGKWRVVYGEDAP